MNTDRRGPGRRQIVVIATVLSVLVAACGSTDGITLESLGLPIEADIQAGATFEVAVPIADDTTLAVASAPPGVTSAISTGPDEGSIRLSIAVDPAAPRGGYNIALLATRGGDTYEIGFPFDVVEPEVGPPATVGGSVDGLLVVESPQPGDLFETAGVITGRASSPTVDYRLSAGETVFAQGTAEVIDGSFQVSVDFENTCCIEMMLEVSQPGVDGLTVTIPLAFPESG